MGLRFFEYRVRFYYYTILLRKCQESHTISHPFTAFVPHFKKVPAIPADTFALCDLGRFLFLVLLPAELAENHHGQDDDTGHQEDTQHTHAHDG